MPADEIKIEGLPQLHSALDGLGRDVRDMREANQAAGDLLARQIGELAPRDTGRLAGSFSGSPAAGGGGAEASSDLVYAPVQEYGSPGHNIEGQHYAERALAAAEPAITSTYDKGAQKACRKAET